MDLPRRDFLQWTARASAGLGVACSQSWLVPIRANQSPRRIRIGQIGVQHAHATKLSVYRESPDFDVVGVVEPDARARQRVAEQAPFRGLPWLTEQQLLEMPDVDAVLVETPVRDLLGVAERCIAAGKHIHLDKPAGAKWPQYQVLLAAAQQKKLLVQMGYMYRYNPAVLLLREFLRQGWLGEVYEVHAAIGKQIDRGEREQLAEFAGGIMFEIGCHLIDLVVGVLGPHSQVTSRQQVTSYRQHVGSADDQLMDNMLAVLITPRTLATVKTSAVEVDGGPRRQLTVCGTRGTFHIQPLDNPTATIALDAPRGEFRKGTQTLTFPKFTRYTADAADMARILRGEKESDYSYEHDLEVQRCVLLGSGMSLA